MKKLLLITCLTALTLSFNSCSDDDSKATETVVTEEIGGTLSFKVNGVQKTFNNVVVSKTDYDGDVYLEVTASVNGSATEYLSFNLWQNDLGSEAVEYFTYVNGSKMYSDGWSTNNTNPQVNSIVQTNSNNKLKGSFSGTVARMATMEGETDEVINLTDGTFEAIYE
ncbi:hypothetical protein [Flavobacterium subsaxonicum]|uniref:Lipoprotein n=1 Tax=Flavobacterium subsaxonicum WB 4.1-42 = DSM 21790 TaxID=1121898 RepID=A0A0A2MIX7_9FLAO|nr:hypothetical protein [Flavobacterium subsaxonicum]KGO92229.1 hypothetical protein Q766_13810 [Flavobacterium subsaxonicum WB 4.1-42 = DSM 21790]